MKSRLNDPESTGPVLMFWMGFAMMCFGVGNILGLDAALAVSGSIIMILSMFSLVGIGKVSDTVDPEEDETREDVS